MESFTGFTADALAFLAELQDNNNRDWFEPRKAQYERLIREPALGFISSMAEPLHTIAPHFTAIPTKSGGSLMRPYRDIRFSPDKRPYKTNIGIQFRHEAGKDVHAPGFYVHIAPDGCFLGVGLWNPPSEPLNRIRKAIADKSEEYRGIVDSRDFRKTFTREGDSLKRPPRGFDPEHPLIEEIKRKDFIASCDIDYEVAISADLIEFTGACFTLARPFMQFLCNALGLRV